jgi:hypothetical protein
VNANEQLELAQAVSAKVKYIGGIGAENRDGESPQDLDLEMADIFSANLFVFLFDSFFFDLQHFYRPTIFLSTYFSYSKKIDYN